MALSLGATLGGWSALEESGSYPVRIALSPEGAKPGGAIGQASEPGEQPRTATPAPLPDFDQAFAELGKPDAPALPAAAGTPGPPPRERDGMLAVRFDLADPYSGSNDGNGQIELRKPVRVNGADVGDATIRVTDGATITIARGDLGKLLALAGRDDLVRSLPAGGGFVSFDRIRQAGLSVRYDAASDRIMLAG